MFCAALAIASPAQTFTTLVDFNGANGAYPAASLVQGTDKNFYGTTYDGGANSPPACNYSGNVGCGTVFKVAAGRRLTTLYNFCSLTNCADGFNPYAGLVQARDGNFYGTTWGGGANGYGTVFRITPKGKLTTLYNFCSQTNCADGFNPSALIQAKDGNFYGTTQYGTVFKITPRGELTTLVACGGQPMAGLVQATDGNLYGETFDENTGTVFKITPGGKLTTLLIFDGVDGANPSGGLIQATDGSFYGTTQNGGIKGYGTVFRITATGELTTLHVFHHLDGAFPQAGVIQARNGNFYGTTSSGGADNTGTVFKITPTGTLTTLHSFNGTDGSDPAAGLIQATNGKFYGTTTNGGTGNNCNNGYFVCGTVFRIAP